MRTLKKKCFLYVIYCILPVLSLGCTTMSNKTQSLQSQAISKFSDLPVPVGFKLLAKDSYSFESSGMRVGLLRYQGKATLDNVVNFYKEQMPMYGWALLNTTQYGDSIMNFDRESETCIVYISPKGSSSVISISLGPKSQVMPKKAKQPVK